MCGKIIPPFIVHWGLRAILYLSIKKVLFKINDLEYYGKKYHLITMEVLTHLAYGRGFLLAIVLIGVAIYWFLKKK